MNWPENYFLINDSLIADISLPGEASGLVNLNKDPRKQDVLPDCYQGKVLEVGAQCKLVKVGDEIVFTRWKYSQSDVDDSRICLREVDLVIVNGRCVNGFIAVQIYKPFKKSEELIQVEKRRETPKNYWGKIVDMDYTSKNLETKDLKEGDIILFQHLDDYQYRIGQYTMVFKDIPDVVVLKMEEVVVPKSVLLEVA